ncbi:hypothetical protein ABH945_007268 [Paraburkholderia sp. GAS333]|uniref:nucleotidyl transferase AbiEii/AbiGii toxin family protein n=1 Tax=Paraburkholderia sp. GAS333 TaxID=3156279 RepID=UPI003D1EFFC0
MDTKRLRADTRLVSERLNTHPLLEGFVLIGDTSRTLRIGHRLSEELVFAWLGQTLPHRRLGVLARELADAGMPMRLNHSAIIEESFSKDGLALKDYQQYLAMDAVKVTFVCLDPPAGKALEGEQSDPLRVATPDEIFSTTCLACAERSKICDWFDLYVLMTRHGYTIVDFYRVFVRYDALGKYDIAAMRLRSGRTQAGDEGDERMLMLEDAPPLEDMKRYFNEEVDRLEVGLAAGAFRAARRLYDQG